MITFTNIILVITSALTALVAGLFYGWSVSVILGLKRLSDREFVSFMQSTNRAIQNPLFFITFFGSAILLPVCAIIHYEQNLRFWFLVAATITYLLGVLGVTIFGNVPLNNKLDSFDLESADKIEIANQRNSYAKPWNLLNHIRAFFSTIVIVLITFACLF